MTNKVILVGSLGKAPEMSKTTNGMTIAKFSLATTKKVKGEKQTQWHNLVAFDKLAEIIQKYTHKGDKLFVIGELKYDSWDKQDGTKGYMTNIVVNEIELLGNSKGETSSKHESTQEGQEAPDDSVPF